MQKINWPLILPLVFLFVVGFAGFLVPANLLGWAKVGQASFPDKASEWLGFFGNIIGAMIAIAAAATAWVIAQRQIRFARQESSVVAFDAFCRILDTVVEEERVVRDLLSAAGRFIAEILRYRTGGPAGQLLRALNTLQPECSQASSDLVALSGKAWGQRRHRDLRRTVRAHAQMLTYDMSHAIKRLQSAGVTSEQLETELQIIVERTAGVTRDMHALIDALEKQRDHLDDLIDKSYASFIE